MAFTDLYTGRFTDEDTAIKQLIDCAVLSIPGEWLPSNGAIGTQILPEYWKGNLDTAIVETIVRNILEPYKDWFVVLEVRSHLNEIMDVTPGVADRDFAFFVDVTVRVVASRSTFVVRVTADDGSLTLMTVNNNNIFTVNGKEFELYA